MTAAVLTLILLAQSPTGRAFATPPDSASPGLRGQSPIQTWLLERERHFALHPELIGKEGSGYNPYMRTRWFVEQRMVDGRLPEEDARLNAWESIQNTPAAGPAWFSLGPANFGGRVLSMTFDPNDPNTLYAGTAGGGLWRSADRGVSWAPLTDGYPFISIGGVAVNPADSNQLMIATGQGQKGSRGISGIGIWRSPDRGNTWAQCSLPTSFERTIPNGFYFLKADPDNGQVLAGERSGLYRSTNWGTTWALVDTITFTDVAFEPGTTRVYGTTKSPGGRGIYLSTDNGASWTSVFNNPSIGLGRVAIAPSDPSIVYALLGHKDGDGLLGVYRSTDQGATWVQQNGDYNLTSGKQSFLHLALAVAPGNPGKLIVGGVNLMRSTDSGVSFTQINDGISNTPHVDYLGAIWDPVVGFNVWIWGDGGVWLSTNEGLNQWSAKSTDLRNVQLYAVGLRASDPTLDVLWAGAQDNGVERRDSGTVNWQIPRLGDGTIQIVHSQNPSTVFASIQVGNQFRSLDDGATFESMVEGLGPESRPWVTPRTANPQNPETLFSGSDSCLYRANAASTCTTCWTPVDCSGVPATALSVSRADTNVVWALMGDHSVRLSTDGGSSFAAVTTPPGTLGGSTDIEAHPTNPAFALVSFSGYGTGSHVFATTDYGATWADRTGDLPDIPVNSIVIPQDHQAWYAGTDLGVFVTTNQGSAWQKYGQGFPYAVVTDVQVHENSANLVAATYGRGAWSVPLLSQVGVAERDPTVALNLILDPPHPNPAAGMTRFRYAAHSPGPVTLRIFDVQGRLVDQVVQLSRGDGVVREAVWNTGGVAPGIYFARLTAGSEHIVQKIVVMTP